MPAVPPLHPKAPGFGVRLAGRFLGGIGEVSAQVEPYTRFWSDQNQLAVDGDGPLLVAIGDSTAIGIGASAPQRSYVGLLGQALARRDGRPWRVVNLAQSGARVADGLDRQLPILDELLAAGIVPDQVLCCLGSNDVAWSLDTFGVQHRLRRLIGGLPASSTVGLIAGASPRGRLVNRAIRLAASEAGLGLVDPWREPGPRPAARLAQDRFHPNDLGHTLMARPFARALGAPEPDHDHDPDLDPDSTRDHDLDRGTGLFGAERSPNDDPRGG